jgi:hypothetical protein
MPQYLSSTLCSVRHLLLFLSAVVQDAPSPSIAMTADWCGIVLVMTLFDGKSDDDGTPFNSPC